MSRWLLGALIAGLPFTLILAAPVASATVVEIPVPELAGHYPVVLPNSEWPSAIIHLPGIPSQIYSVALRVRGTTEVGALNCEGAIVPWGTQTGSYFGTALPQVWFADEVNGSTPGAFEWTTGFEPWNAETSWSMFLDGSERLFLQAGASGYILICFPTTPEPTVEIEQVTVIVDADFAVPAPPSTWGRIKAAYR